MAALTDTAVGQAMNDNHIQLYGGINAGGNFSNATVRGGMRRQHTSTTPTPCSSTRRCSDRALARHGAEGSRRLGLRFAPISGENDRYATAYGLWSYWFLNHNSNYGYQHADGLW